MKRLHKFPSAPIGWFATLLLAGLTACVPQPPEGMVWVPSGHFSMGTDETDDKGHALSLGLNKPWFADESPAQRLDLPDFFIDRFEVTNQQFYIFCQATDHRPPPGWKGMKYPDGEDDLPVTTVNFYDAAAYAEWAGKRLPSEAEWEKAARGPTDFDYPWGSQFDFTRANLSSSAKKKFGNGLKPVGSFPQGSSPYGAEDMIGNVWEWVHDYYQPYPGNRSWQVEFSKESVVVRGMSFMGVGHFPEKEYRKVVALKSRVSYREKLHPVLRKPDLGFRCAKDVPSFWETLNETGKKKVG